MQFQIGDQVQIDAVGTKDHGKWGFVHEVGPLSVWVWVLDYATFHQAYPMGSSVEFEPWELVLINRKGEDTS